MTPEEAAAVLRSIEVSPEARSLRDAIDVAVRRLTECSCEYIRGNHKTGGGVKRNPTCPIHGDPLAARP